MTSSNAVSLCLWGAIGIASILSWARVSVTDQVSEYRLPARAAPCRATTVREWSASLGEGGLSCGGPRNIQLSGNCRGNERRAALFQQGNRALGGGSQGVQLCGF